MQDLEKWIQYLHEGINYYYQAAMVEPEEHWTDATTSMVRRIARENGLPSGDVVDEHFWKALTGQSSASPARQTGQGQGKQAGTGQATGQQAGTGQATGQQAGTGQATDQQQDGYDQQVAAGADGEWIQQLGYQVQLQQQPDSNSSWAAAMAMLFAFKGENHSADSLVQQYGSQVSGWREALEKGKELGLYEVELSDTSAAGWAGMLADQGPLWTPLPSDDRYVVLVADMGQDTNGPMIRVLDPVTGQDMWWYFDQFCQQYGIFEGDQVQLLAK